MNEKIKKKLRQCNGKTHPAFILFFIAYGHLRWNDIPWVVWKLWVEPSVFEIIKECILLKLKEFLLWWKFSNAYHGNSTITLNYKKNAHFDPIAFILFFIFFFIIMMQTQYPVWHTFIVHYPENKWVSEWVREKNRIISALS
jgi:hypothetical protein